MLFVHRVAAEVDGLGEAGGAQGAAEDDTLASLQKDIQQVRTHCNVWAKVPERTAAKSTVLQGGCTT